MTTRALLNKAQVKSLNAFWTKFDMKFCNKCGTTQDATDFYAGKAKCKKCFNDECMVRYAANRDQITARMRSHYQQNREAILADQRVLYQRNREAVLARVAAYKERNREAVLEAKRICSRRYRQGGRPIEKDWTDQEIGYRAAHSRVEATFGPASKFDCSLCDQPAAQWAYDHLDVGSFSGSVMDHRQGKARVVYWSGNPNHYMPMCIPCHIKFDKRK